MKKTLQIIIPLVVIGLVIGLLSQQQPRQIDEPNESVVSLTRIVSIHPAATEIIYALGRADRLVGVSDYCTYPPEAQDKTIVGNSLSPNTERLQRLQPQLILISGQNPNIVDFCNEKGLEVRNLHMESVDEILAGIQTLGELLEAEPEADRLCEEIQVQIEQVKARAAQYPPTEVFFSLYRTPGSLAGVTTVGPQTYLSELITLAGGYNIFDDVTAPYPQISKETLVKRQPQVIIEPRPRTEMNEVLKQQLCDDWAHLDIPAVQAHRIYFPDADRLLKPGPRVGLAALELVDMIHPSH